jgi:hypothetical protein
MAEVIDGIERSQTARCALDGSQPTFFLLSCAV